MLPVTAIVMTYNEEQNIEACLKSIFPFVSQIIIVDSSSTDDTLIIAKKYNCEIYTFNSSIQSEVIKWAFINCDFKHNWIIRVDADERWTKEGFEELENYLSDESVNGVYIRRKVFFMGKWLRYGGMYKSHFAVVFRKDKAIMEDRLMDEHLVIDGKIVKSTIDVIEANYDRQENISLWTDKHNRYSTREAVEYLISEYRVKQDTLGSIKGSGVNKKRWLKNNFYYKMPIFLRPFLYFFQRYFLQLAILDGRAGFIHTMLQGFWYRFLVDTKIYQIRNLANANNTNMEDYLKSKYPKLIK